MTTKASRTTPRGSFPQSSFKYDPLTQIRAVYIQFIQYLFYQAPRGQYHWDEDPNLSEVVITGEVPLDVEGIGKRPFITVSRGAVNFSSLGFDDMDRFNMESGAKMKSIIIPGTVAINVGSRNDSESENLAWVVAEHIWLLRDQLMAAGFVDVGRNLQIGPPSRPGGIIQGDNNREWFVTTIVSPYTFGRTSQITPLGKPTVSEIETSISVELQEVPDNSPPSAQGRPEVPVNINRYMPDASNDPNELKPVPHPLNPAQLVTVRSTRPNSPALRPPSIGGRLLISKGPVEQSSENSGATTVVKVS